MRLEAVEKLGYYPTPPKTLEALVHWLASEGRGRALDPCCGKGEALAYLAERLNLETYGVELSDERAQEARKVLDHFLGPCAWESVWASRGAFTFVLLNPPYDWEGGNVGEKKERLEWTFLRSITPHVAPEGVLVYIIPQARITPTIARHLAGFYRDLEVRRLPEEEYGRFRQVVILGKKRRRYDVDESAKDYLLACRELGEALPPLDQDIPRARYVVPEAPAGPVRFFRAGLSDAEIISAYVEGSPFLSQAWRDLVEGREEEIALRPAMPLKMGHLAMLISAGLMGTLRLAGDDGTGPLLVKGRVTKRVETSVEEVEPGKTREISTEYFVTQITTVDRDGAVERIEDPPALEAFMKRHGAELGRLMMERFTPTYNFDPSDREWATVSRLVPEKRLPGRTEAGLLPTQKHVAISAARTIRRHRAAIINGEMGVGKTMMALATVELLDAYPAVVLCPSHLVGKWVREARDTIPGVHAVEVGSVADLVRFVAAYREGRLPRKSIVVVSKEKAKLGPGWKPAVLAKAVPVLENGKVVRGPNGRAVVRRRILCPTCGAVQVDDDGLPLVFDHFAKKPRRCRECGGALYTLGEADGAFNDLGTGRTTTGLRLRHGYRRVPVADYVRRKLRHFFALLVADEVHQYKGKSTDQGRAFQVLAASTRLGVLALTGTLFGGKATNLFWLLYRMARGVRRDFGFHDEIRWASRYGRLQTITTKVEAEEAAGWNARTRYYNRTKEIPGVSPAIVSRLLDITHFVQLTDLGYPLPPYEEDLVLLPMTPQMREQYRGLDETLKAMMREAKSNGDNGLVSVWLQTTLSRPTSAFREEWVVRYPGTDRQDVILGPLPPLVRPAEWGWVTGNGRRHRGPDPERDRQLAVDLPSYLPKEEWLADFCKAEVSRGRKVLVYLRQTGTRDVRPRYKSVLQNAGLRVGVLPASIPPRRRERWLSANIPRLDVLITNPRLVETGLDLYDFATIVWVEIDYSLYTMWQACRRVWRLGQTKPVRVVYVAYEDTMEANALGLMGEKMRAAQILYGDEVAGALVGEEDDREFLARLAREVLEGKVYDLQKLFAEQNRGTASPLGSPTAESPRMPVSPPSLPSGRMTLEQARELYGAARRRRRRKAGVPPEQMALWSSL